MELFRALGALLEPPEAGWTTDRLRLVQLLDLAEGDDPLPSSEAYTDLFLFQLYPYASVYLGPEGMLGGEARDRIGGFLRALGAKPPQEPDHLAFLLAAYADLGAQGDESVPSYDPKLVRARKAFLWEHLLCWLPAWLHALRRLQPAAFFLRWADLLDASLRREAVVLGMPDELPLHLREAPALEAAEAADEFVGGLLAPVRSGLVLVRGDLRRAADGLGLGLRAGERRYVVEHLLGQDPDAVLRWMADEADDWAAHWAEQSWLGDVGRWWEDRARQTARIFRGDPKIDKPAPSEGGTND